MLKCIFQCGQDGNYDGLRHYLKCEKLWEAIQDEWVSLGGGRLKSKPTERLTLCNEEASKLEWAIQASALLAATDIYHSIRHKPHFDFHAEARASIVQARNHGLLVVRRAACGETAIAWQEPSVAVSTESPNLPVCNDFCEPECSDVAHHPNCSQAILGDLC